MCRSCTRSSLRPSPCLGCDPSRTKIFAVFAAASLPCQFLHAVGYALVPAAALSRCCCSFLPAVGPLFPFFSVPTASATSLTSTCLFTCSSSFHNCFARQLSLRYVSCNATLLSRALPPLHGCEPSVSTSCSLVHVLTHVFSARSFTCCAWSGGLPAPLSLSSARCACGGSLSPELGLVRHACVAINLRSALAEGLSVDAIVFRVHFRSLPRCSPAEPESRGSLPAAVPTACVWLRAS